MCIETWKRWNCGHECRQTIQACPYCYELSDGTCKECIKVHRFADMESECNLCSYYKPPNKMRVREIPDLSSRMPLSTRAHRCVDMESECKPYSSYEPPYKMGARKLPDLSSRMPSKVSTRAQNRGTKGPFKRPVKLQDLGPDWHIKLEVNMRLPR